MLIAAARAWPSASPVPDSGAARGQDRRVEAEERDPARRRRHGPLRGHARTLLRQGRGRAPEHGRLASAAARSTTSAPGPRPDLPANYVGDSAPTATAWSTGKRTGRPPLAGPSAADNIPGPNEGYTTYMEIARDAGKATGNVSTAEITDATPAAPSRTSPSACQGPADTRTTARPRPRRRPARPGSIAEQQVDDGFDLTWAAAAPATSSRSRRRHRERHRLRQGPRATRTSTPSGARRRSARGTSGNKVLGLFNASNMTTEFAPLFARTAAYYARNPNRNVQVQGGSDTTRCQPQNRGNEPSLPEMTTKALQLLEHRQGRLRPPGRGRLDRQARPRRRRLRPDR